MALVVYSNSVSFKQHIDHVLSEPVIVESSLKPLRSNATIIHLVHASCFKEELFTWLDKASTTGALIVIAEDVPDVKHMLDCSQYGVQGYCNAYMTASNYKQMLRLLRNNQSWYPPQLLAKALELAHKVVQQPRQDPLKELTPREREIALAVAEGKSNKAVANVYDISERTVKAHLTHIFEKLRVKDRVALVIYIKQSGSAASDYSLMG